MFRDQNTSLGMWRESVTVKCKKKSVQKHVTITAFFSSSLSSQNQSVSQCIGFHSVISFNCMKSEVQKAVLITSVHNSSLVDGCDAVALPADTSEKKKAKKTCFKQCTLFLEVIMVTDFKAAARIQWRVVAEEFVWPGFKLHQQTPWHQWITVKAPSRCYRGPNMCSLHPCGTLWQI